MLTFVGLVIWGNMTNPFIGPAGTHERPEQPLCSNPTPGTGNSQPGQSRHQAAHRTGHPLAGSYRAPREACLQPLDANPAWSRCGSQHLFTLPAALCIECLQHTEPSPTLTPPLVLICADLPLHMQPSCMAVVPKLAGCLTMSARHPKTTPAIMHGCSTASAAGSVQPL